MASLCLKNIARLMQFDKHLHRAGKVRHRNVVSTIHADRYKYHPELKDKLLKYRAWPNMKKSSFKVSRNIKSMLHSANYNAYASHPMI